MAESAREYPRRDLVLPPFLDMADAGGKSILARFDAYPSGEGFSIARRQAQELRACMDARCEATGHRDPALDAVSSRLDAVIARAEGAEPVVTADMIRAAEPAPMPSQMPRGSRLEAIVSANLVERQSALDAIEADPAAYANLPEHVREDRAIALAAVRANAENFDKVPDELRKNSEFRRESMRTNPLIARRWSYYEHADSREVRLVFDQVERSPSLLAGMRPEIIVQFLVQRAPRVRPEHFSVLPDWHLSVTIRKLLARNPAVTSFGSPDNPVTLSDVVRDMRPQILFDIERGAQSPRGARDETKLAASARYAASLFRDPRVFEGAPDIFPETIRDAIPSALWADPVYVRHLLVALGMESFPPALLSAEVRTSLGLPDMFEGSQIGELSRVRTIADLLASPNLLLSLEADPSLVRALPLASQNDGPLMAYLIERVPAIVTGRFLSSEALAQREVIRACHSMLDTGSGTGSVPLDYERLTVADMSDLATAYGKGITLDLRFLERIESGMSQGRQDATEWKNLYGRLYDQERQLVSGVRSILYRSERTVRGDGGDFNELLLDEKAWSAFAGPELGAALSGLDEETIGFIKSNREILHGLLSQVGTSDNDTWAVYWYVSTLGEKMKNNPKLAGRLQVALVRINQAYHEGKLREVGIDASARFSQDADSARRAEGFLERFVSDEKITDPDIAKWVGQKAPATKKVDAEAPERAEYDKTWARLCETFESRAREYLRTHPAGPGERPGVVFDRALASAFADTGDLDPQTVASLRTAIAEEYWYRRKQGTLASSATADAMTGRVSREEFVRRAEAVAALATEHYASGLSAEESLAIVASPQYLSAVRTLAPQASVPAAPGASSLGYPSAPDGSLVVRTADSSVDYRLDPATGTVSSPEGLSLSVRPDADRDAVERAVSSLDFLRASGLAFLGSDVSRVFELAHRLDPAASLRPEDGLDEAERSSLLSALLPFFGVELPAGAIYTDMTAALDRINHGTSDAQSGLLLRLVERGVGYIDSDTLAFDFRAFETAFVISAKERFDSAPVSI